MEQQTGKYIIGFGILIIVIGIPNCIYFLNKFHTSYRETGDKRTAMIDMISKMGVVTLFCNITAAIGFAVFGLTRSAILKEFGIVAGANILALFFISLFLIPAILSMLPDPKPRHMRYLHNPQLNRWLGRLEAWSLNHRKLIYSVTAIVILFFCVGHFTSSQRWIHCGRCTERRPGIQRPSFF